MGQVSSCNISGTGLSTGKQRSLPLVGSTNDLLWKTPGGLASNRDDPTSLWTPCLPEHLALLGDIRPLQGFRAVGTNPPILFM